ncbi:MAG: hypothetical protein AAB378_01820 [Patescibacteria group bacterium]
MKFSKPFIDYTLLDKKASLEQYMELCRTAKLHSDIVRSVCVPPVLKILKLCVRETKGSGIFVCAVNDFPFGNGGIKRKNRDTITAYVVGAGEIDTVVNLPSLSRGHFRLAYEEIEKFVASTPVGVRIKVILETGHVWYNDALIKEVSAELAKIGVFALKTSTGLKNVDTPAGFLPEISLSEKIYHASLMHEAAPEAMIKVAGGIKTAADVKQVFSVLPPEKVLIGTSSPVWNLE